MITVPFYEMIDTDSEIWRLINKQRFPSLYPPNTLPDEIIENINVYFYNRQIAYSSPERFVMQWWRLMKERAYAWTKLLQTEKVLRDDDMLFNYDLTEDSTDKRTGEGSSHTKNTPNLKTLTTPDILTTQNVNGSQKTGTTQSGENIDDYNQSNREMDTPDGITGDINNYLTKASTQSDNTNTKNSSRTDQNSQNANKTVTRQIGNNWEYRLGEDDTNTATTSKDDNVHHLRRYGNIGTMTVASVLGGYREAQQFDVYNAVIFPECENLFLHYVELDEIDLW